MGTKSETLANRTAKGVNRQKKPADLIRKEAMKMIVANNVQWADRYKFPEIQTPEECAERLNFFFEWCAKNGEYPTIEKLYLALGGYYKKVSEWEFNATKGFEISEMIKAAKQIIAAIDAELASTNNLPQVLYIFRAKNFYGMKDVRTNEDVRTIQPEIDEKKLAEKYNIIDIPENGKE